VLGAALDLPRDDAAGRVRRAGPGVHLWKLVQEHLHLPERRVELHHAAVLTLLSASCVAMT
jgi:hypothetical protein